MEDFSPCRCRGGVLARFLARCGGAGCAPRIVDHKLRTGRRDSDLIFGATESSPLDHVALQRRADRAWKAAKLSRITLHECRHTFASIAIAAGVNIGTVSAAMGHSSVKVTWDRYHHLMPGTMDEAAELIQTYIARRSG